MLLGDVVSHHHYTGFEHLIAARCKPCHGRACTTSPRAKDGIWNALSCVRRPRFVMARLLWTIAVRKYRMMLLTYVRLRAYNEVTISLYVDQLHSMA
jgi:hypothetical protein